MFPTVIIPAVTSASEHGDVSVVNGEAFLLAILLMMIMASSIVYLAMVLLNEGFKAFLVALCYFALWLSIILASMFLCSYFI